MQNNRPNCGRQYTSLLEKYLCDYAIVAALIIFFSFILVIHEGSQKEVYQEFQPSYDIVRRW